uniref:Apple domain-containing protein n=1 Tax=Bursaphelenchus xylophilus TaxID=6326 RepID=A0A1I7S9K1_BURXY
MAFCRGELLTSEKVVCYRKVSWLGLPRPTAVAGKIMRAIRCANRNAVGDRTACIAFTHDSVEEKCELFDEAIKEIGIFTRIEARASATSVAERICIKKSLGCDDGISSFKLIYKQKVNGYILGQVTNLETVTDCLSICFGNPQCKSVTFKKGWCTLHSVYPLEQNLSPADSSTAAFSRTCEKL